MPTIQQAKQVLDRHYLEIRCSILDIAGALDRIERSDKSSEVAHDPRMELIQEALKILGQNSVNRAEQVQLLFSDQYVPGWNQK
ncbi:hypothetical protein SH668x_001877 [Planctomicrobium sp. SH668]|uniref:hypothetical protein n=1 Tax=Planctomicrobium sp. SH668 TaxID=3448126 RepID=UPI003F5BD09D